MNNRRQLNNTIYYEYGETKKPVIVMIHGFRGTHHGLALIAKFLKNYRVIVPDLPGFGESKPLEGEHNLDNYVKWLDKFITGLNLDEKPVLVGHSFGSIVTSCYASRHSGSIDKFILINPIGAPALSGPRGVMTRLALFYYWIGKKTKEPVSTHIMSSKAVTMIMSITMAKTKDKTVRSFIHNQHIQHFSSFYNAKTVGEAFKTSTKHCVRDFASQISNPTLLIAGDRDDITPIEKQQELVKAFPNAHLEIIKGVGHLTHYETPEIVAKLISDYIG